MDPRRSKRLCVRSSRITSIAESKRRPSDKPCPRIPEETLEDIFKYCDLRTRCKARRVSARWNHFVSLPEVNEVVTMDRSCLLVRKIFPNPLRCPPTCGHRSFNTTNLGCLVRDKDDSLQNGWYEAGESNTKFNLQDHKRQGLLGPHVRVIIFDDEHDIKYEHCANVRVLKSIGMYCTGVKHIVMRNLGHIMKELVDLGFVEINDFQPTPGSGLPLPESLTILNSDVVAAFFRVPTRDMHRCPLKISVTKWCDLGQSQEVSARQFLDCTPAQLDWLAKYAPDLPEKYHKWARDGIEIVWCGNHGFTPVSMDLRNHDFDNKNPWALRIIEICILLEGVNSEPPPQPFDYSYLTKKQLTAFFLWKPMA